MPWNDERVELLKKMWGEGQSASQIAKELGGVTRNAVIGKVHRLGLSNRSGSGGPATSAGSADTKSEVRPETKATKTVSKSAPKPAPKPEMTSDPAPAATQPSRIKAIIPAGQPLPPQPSANEIDPEALAKVNEIEKKARKLTLMELTERTCKWPVGDPATPNFWFCGLPVQSGKPYCEAHVGVAFQPMSSRRDRKR
ncbi:GcrA cell cycle regulator [Roseovarius azorensis]|uniref:GcrA cell cycle regulator n=1 Tax=Roseovarius azorensis TaxID=1287727 RepID=A0A1H7FII6_9RHOB|nr:GcrA family cell cycle regulator [Roseovarius azorensis]SEK25923.1 GcrA cell cycle regulator [Roseovarius azorensis]